MVAGRPNRFEWWHGAIAACLALLLWLSAFSPHQAAIAVPSLVHADAAAQAPWYPLRIAQDVTKFLPQHAPLAGPPPAVNAAAGIVVDIDSNQILWSLNPHTALPPASTTKIMTALVVLANFSPDKKVRITAAALNQAADETRMGLKAGEVLTVKELLQGALLVSANDAAMALAVDTVGMKPFVAAMNAQEAALGLHDSHFTTPVGLDSPGHAISAYDEAVMAAYAVKKYPLFAQIVASAGMTLPATATHQAYVLENVNPLLGYYPAADGIKGGYTGAAGPCLVGMAQRNGHRLVVVLFNAPYTSNQERDLLDWAFAQEGLPRQYPPTSTP